MVRKIVMMLLTGAICVIGGNSLLAKEIVFYSTIEKYEEAVGTKIEKFSEAPMLKEKVATGELPSVNVRLPEEPLVVQPFDKIGKYGGTLRTNHTGNIDFLEDVLREYPLTFLPAQEVVEPNVFKSWEMSEDARTFIFHLRKGMKWSDGYPFTADDFMFWYEDIALNKELRPGGVANLKIAGEPGTVEKIDDYTIKFSFAKSYGVLVERLARWRPVIYAPKHYLKQFHPNYTSKDELDKIVKKEGFDSWVLLFEAKRYYMNNIETPTISAWKVLTKFSEPVHRLVRNAYYWKIDTAGNQLPYTDGLNMIFVGDREGALLQALAGEVDYLSSYELGLAENYPVLKKNEKKGNYRLDPFTVMWPDQAGAVLFNYSSKDPVLRKIFGDKRFRIALSVAMDRDEINEVVFKGMYKPSQLGPGDVPPFRGELPMFHVYTHYDPQLANQLLDVMGLKWDKNREVRLRPDGKRLELVMDVNTHWIQHVPMAEMYKKYWKDIGIQTTIKPLGHGFFQARIAAGQYEIGIRALCWGGRRPNNAAWRPEPVPIYPDWVLNPPWARWLLTDGKKGEEPPEGVKRLLEIHKEFMSEPDVEKRIALTKELYLIHSENLWAIGGIKQPWDVPQIQYSYLNNRIKNVPVPGAVEWTYNILSSWSIEE